MYLPSFAHAYTNRPDGGATAAQNTTSKSDYYRLNRLVLLESLAQALQGTVIRSSCHVAKILVYFTFFLRKNKTKLLW